MLSVIERHVGGPKVISLTVLLCRGVDEDLGKMRILLLQQIGFALPGMFSC